MTQQLFVARLRSADPDQPVFSRTMPAGQLLAELAKQVPADKIYAVISKPDGSYSFREAGHVILDIQAPGDQPPAAPPPSSIVDALPDTDYSSQEEHGEELASDPLPTPSPASQRPTMEPLDGPDDYQPFKFDKPVSQAEALARKGIIEGPPATPKSVKKATTRKGKKPARKAATPDDESALPTTTSRPGKMVTNGWSPATPESAAAADHFGEDFS